MHSGIWVSEVLRVKSTYGRNMFLWNFGSTLPYCKVLCTINHKTRKWIFNVLRNSNLTQYKVSQPYESRVLQNWCLRSQMSKVLYCSLFHCVGQTSYSNFQSTTLVNVHPSSSTLYCNSYYVFRSNWPHYRHRQRHWTNSGWIQRTATIKFAIEKESHNSTF
jgi:hypothetical protein